MRSGLQSKTQESAFIRRIPNNYLTLSILPNLAAWEWVYRSVVPLLKVTADGSGPRRTMVPAQPFSLILVLVTGGRTMADDLETCHDQALSLALERYWGDYSLEHPSLRFFELSSGY
jgi:hypothetical protein